MHGRLITEVAFEISNLNVSWDCCTVPIDDEMIRGLDYLAVYYGIANIKECTISLENSTFPVKLIQGHKGHLRSYVQTRRTMCIQPNISQTKVRVPVQLKNHLTGENVVSPVRLKSERLGSHTLGSGNTTAMIFINDSGTALKIREAGVYAEIYQEEESPSAFRKNQASVQVGKLPEHLIELYYRATPELNDREKVVSINCLWRTM